VLAGAADTETFIVADLDADNQREIRRRLPSLARRRPEVYAWEAPAAAAAGDVPAVTAT
jgi:predicted amidohydrolase